MPPRRIAAAFAMVAVLGTAAAFALRGTPAQAVIAGSPCAGNVCTGTIVVGGQTVGYSYTQHLSSSGEFRIRLNGGVYNTAGLVSFIIHDVPAFSTTGYLANPTNGAQAMSEIDVNPGHTAYERKDSDGCPSCIYDHVMSLQYSGLPAGTYAFSFTVVQNGDSGGRNALPFYVDATAPTNGNESTTWTAGGAPVGMDFPCADTIDNDLDFRADCADAQCSGSVGQVATGARCQIPETTCNDEFDNDADGKPDCLDADCDGRVGQPLGTALCQYLNERGAGCTDGFNNDGDVDPADSQPLIDCVDNLSSPGGNPANYCWKQVGYGCPAVENCATGIDDDKDKSYDDAWDKSAGTGVNCQDYDCAGNAACPARENKTAANADADAQCFDTLDNDLDHLTDCADPDCAGIVNPGNTNQVCYEKEFDLGQSYQFCGNFFDDDGDGPQDCADSDCSRRFGNCGPCPAREDFTFDSCTNDGTFQPRDDDSDAAASCADIDCIGKLGTLANAAMCASAESSNDLCADGFDNDLDTKIDCADTQCAGRIGPFGATCQLTESSCGDGKDNDGDGLIDCVDPHCAGVGSCAPANWTLAPSCQIVPRYSGPTAFTGNDPTVTTVVRLATWVSTTDTVRLMGSGTYSSVTVILGDNTDPLKYYPYAAYGPACALSGTNAGRFGLTVVPGHAIQVYNTPGPDINGFDITLTCTTPAAPAALRNYPISLSALKEPGGIAEYGDLNFSTTLYEHTAPSVVEVEPEAEMAGTFTVPFGGFASPPLRRFRGVPNDPGAGLNASGICRCQLDLDGTVVDTGADCVSTGASFTADKAGYSVRGRAEDGAGNLGAYSGPQSFTLNVTPIVKTPLTLGPSKPFIDTDGADVTVDAEFATGSSDFFNASCSLYVRDGSGNVAVSGPVGPSATFPALPPFVAATRCQATVTLSPLPADGTYFVTVKQTDNDGDSVETNRKVLYVCNTVPAAGDPEPTNGCQYADFDGDGAAEGLYTTVYSATPKACDNCVGLSNDQTDANANGVGDICEPNNSQYGRCEIDTEIVCSYHSNDPVHCPGDLCCPGPSNGIDYSNDLSPAIPAFQPKDPQFCKFAWGLCTFAGQVCFDDAECPGEAPNNGIGRCQDNLTTCKRDVDCDAVAGTAKCGGRCQDDATWCVTATDCNAVSGTPKCNVADVCENLLFPWLQTIFGNVFSKKKISAPDVPPQNQYNATFCITAKDTITKFSSQGLGGCVAETDASVRYELPQGTNTYSTVLGKLDLAGLRAGRYGTVIDVAPGTLDATLSGYSNRLGGRVFRVTSDVTVGSHTIFNDAVRGAGTILVDGGDLTIVGDITYDTASVTSLDQLASLGWIVVPNGAGAKGNVFVRGDVLTVSGAFYVGGTDGFYSVAPPDPDSPAPLTLYGMVIARQFHLSRSFKSLTQGSERFIYDGRAVVDPPPGFGDITRALPLFTDTPTAP
ncbi:MAG TPA: hypothetical protein VL500_01945 [Candidatus Eisenbacteria bacterium]|nr:hypothetical protein [Candidatus Eisenbacteria bacterium]